MKEHIHRARQNEWWEFVEPHKISQWHRQLRPAWGDIPPTQSLKQTNWALCLRPRPDGWVETNPDGPASGTFRACQRNLGRLYFPIANEAGMLSWTSPQLHGSAAISHHEHLSVPLTAEDLPHTLVHRDFWIVEESHRPFSVAGLSPEELSPRHHPSSETGIEAGIGWFTLNRRGPNRRFLATATLWCPADFHEPVEILRVVVTNTSSHPIRFIPYAAIPLFCRSADNVRDHRHVTALLHRVELLKYGLHIQPAMSFDERGHKPNTTQYTILALGPQATPPTDIWALEEDFLGDSGTFAAPKAVWNRQRAAIYSSEKLSGREAIGGFRFAPRTLAPKDQATYCLISGISHDPQRHRHWLRWARQLHTIHRSLEKTKSHWLNHTRRITFFTSDRPLDHWLAWVNAQPIFRRLYGNSYLPQFDYGRGGRGWRDLWQDCLALLLSDPKEARPLLLYNTAGIRIDGSNATIIERDGTFSADRNNIPRTWMDHGIWPVHTILLYLDQTVDVELLLENQTYFRDPQILRCRQLDPRWSPAYGLRLRTRRGRIYQGSVLEHLLVQTLTAFFNVGEHNVCRLEGADWNDGLDMASHRGESVAFSAFYAWNLKRLAELMSWLSTRGIKTIEVFEELILLLDRLPAQEPIHYRSAQAKRKRLNQYLDRVSHDISGERTHVRLQVLAADLMQKCEDLSERIRKQEWVRAQGEQFFNGYYDDRGRRVEGNHSKGIRLTLTGQVFPVMTGMATDVQLKRVVRAVNRWLRDPKTGGIRLNTDFKEPQPHLGRAFCFAYGDKENGAVFSHMAVMYAYALYVRRQAHEGRKVWSNLYRMATNQAIAKIFPCLPEYFNRNGRGMYCYLTGSASWLVYLLLTQVYGIRGERGDLVIDPQLTREDFGDHHAIAVETSFAERRLRIHIANPKRLRPGEYAVLDVRTGDRSVPFTTRSEGGVRIVRRVLEQLPATHCHLLSISLGR